MSVLRPTHTSKLLIRTIPSPFHHASTPPHAPIRTTPLRTFTSSPALLKKSKTQAAKLSKGKVRNEDDPSETDVDVQGALDKTRAKMQKASEWARGQVWEGVERARGRVSPGMSSRLSSLISWWLSRRAASAAGDVPPQYTMTRSTEAQDTAEGTQTMADM